MSDGGGPGAAVSNAERGPLLLVAEALRRILTLTPHGPGAPLGAEVVPLDQAAGRVLAEPLTALRTQPPFDAAAMDGWAVRSADVQPGAVLRAVGAAAAGRRSEAGVGAGEAVRIFTGAPMPEGADAVLIQEDADASPEGDRLTAREAVTPGLWVRHAGGDFRADATLLAAGERLGPEAAALAAAAGRPWITVARAPRLALLSLGDELRLPGEPLGPDDIVASNGFGVAALAREVGAEAWSGRPVPDQLDALRAAFRAAATADVIVTLGGASDGVHDLARPALAAEGGALEFHKIAMRPGKPLSAGRLGRQIVLGLPGNPVSAMVCARLFLCPLLERLQGLPGGPPPRFSAETAVNLPANGPREHYMRARAAWDGAALRLTPVDSQDSSLLSRLADANVLLVRPPHAPAVSAGAPVMATPLRRDVMFHPGMG